MVPALDIRLGIHILKLLGVAIGGIISARSMSAYFRTKSRDLGLFALGFMLLTLGIFFGEFLSFFTDDLLILILIETFFVLIGFISMLTAFYVKLTHSYRIPENTDIILGDDRYSFAFEDMKDSNDVIHQVK